MAQDRDRRALLDRFEGALLGTAVGDALGAPFEGWPQVPRQALAGWEGAVQPLRWTDDTHMTIAVAESLIACGGFDGPDMAARFAASYDQEPWRGYGAGPPQVFAALRRGARWDEPAARLFGGRGSYGNGAAMRAAPAGLFGHPDLRETARLARGSARTPHAHQHGQDGAAPGLRGRLAGLGPGASRLAGARAARRAPRRRPGSGGPGALGHTRGGPVGPRRRTPPRQRHRGTAGRPRCPVLLPQPPGVLPRGRPRGGAAGRGHRHDRGHDRGAGRRVPRSPRHPRAWLDRLEQRDRLVQLASRLLAARQHTS